MLKFENVAKVGDRIKALDFTTRDDCYVVGTVVEAGMLPEGFKAYKIICEEDVFCGEPVVGDNSRMGVHVFIPFEIFILESDNRIIKVLS